MTEQFDFNDTGSIPTIALSALLLVLPSCIARGPHVPDTAILSEIQVTLDAAIASTAAVPVELLAPDSDLLSELLPSLSLDEILLAPVEERISITSPNLPADVFFNSLVVDTDYGVVISEDVDVSINLSLPNVTIEEAMDIIAEIYNLDVTLRGNIFTVREGGLRTRQFTIDYLNVQRQGTSSISVSAQGGQGGGGGFFSGVGSFIKKVLTFGGPRSTNLILA